MALNLASASITATGTTQTRTFGNRFSDVLNVKDFGAVGDFMNDDRRAIQDCFDAAFGSAGSPHEQIGNINKAVYFPTGEYHVSDYLTLTSVWGGRIFGDGWRQTSIGPNTGITSVALERWRPIIWVNGCNYVHIHDISFSQPKDTSTLTLTSISNGSPAIFTLNAHGITEGEIISLGTNGTLPSPLIAQASSPQPVIYYAVNVTTNTFQVAYDLYSSAISTTSAGSGTHSVILHRTICLWFGPNIATGGGSSAHGNLLQLIETVNSNYGFIFGSADSAANSENTFINCNLLEHDVGLFVSGGNTLNFKYIGGSIDFCKLAGIKTNNNAAVGSVISTSLSRNYIDFDIASAGHMCLMGVRTESQPFVKTNANVFAACCSQSVTFGTATGSTSGSVLTVTSTTIFIGNGQVIDGGGITSGTRILAQINGSGGGAGDYLLSNNVGSTSATYDIYCVYGDIVGSGSLNLDSPSCPVAVAIVGGGSGGNLFIRNNYFQSPANLLKFCNSQVHQYDLAGQGVYVFSGLPTAKAALKGLRMFITDSSVTTFGSNAAGGGSTTVPIYCDGTNWKVG